jgi:hypothetical protein
MGQQFLAKLCRIRPQEDPFSGSRQTDEVTFLTGVLFRRYGDTPQIDFGTASFIIYSGHVSCLDNKSYGMVYMLYTRETLYV